MAALGSRLAPSATAPVDEGLRPHAELDATSGINNVSRLGKVGTGLGKFVKSAGSGVKSNLGKVGSAVMNLGSSLGKVVSEVGNLIPVNCKGR
eukprot:3528928-Prymnesium_polylepis.1